MTDHLESHHTKLRISDPDHDVHIHEQFLQLSVGLGLVLCVCLGLAFYMFPVLAYTISFLCSLLLLCYV